MDQVIANEVAQGVYLIDSGMIRIGLAACYLLERNGRFAIVETGTHHSVPSILTHLKERGVNFNQVDYVIPTHVHLDHAGGVGLLMQDLPYARLVIHPKGARHMVDPTKLQAGATAVYGEAAFQEMYGDLIPVDDSRIVIADDGDELLLGGETLKFVDTPGHANHHFCVWDAVTRSFFTGDTFGIAYRELMVDGQPFIFPTTTPVQFDPDALKASIGKLLAMQPKRMYLTHYGVVENPKALAPQLLEQIDAYVSLVDQAEAEVKKSGAQGEQQEVMLLDAILTRLTDYTLKRAVAHGCETSVAAETIAFDMGLNAQGLVVWSARRAATR